MLAPREDLSHTVKLCSLYAGLAASARLAEEAGVTLYLEPLNISTDHPGNFLRDTQTAAELVRLIGSPRLKVLYDIYHMQLNEGRLCDTIRQYADTFGHVHAADAPGRREPGTGEIAFPRVYKALEAAGYTGLVGYELFPRPLHPGGCKGHSGRRHDTLTGTPCILQKKDGSNKMHSIKIALSR